MICEKNQRCYDIPMFKNDESWKMVFIFKFYSRPMWYFIINCLEIVVLCMEGELYYKKDIIKFKCCL